MVTMACTAIRRVSRIACFSMATSRNLSMFSFFRSKHETDKQQPSEQSKQPNVDEATTLWLDAIKQFESSELVQKEHPNRYLSRPETRRMKKRAFLHVIQVYLQRHGKARRGFNQFALNALNKMEEYEVTDDLECYKAIISLFPVGRMVVTGFLQPELGYYLRQQETVIELLRQMIKYHVMPDDEIGQMIIDIFGWRNHAMQHYRQLMYWIPKLAHANPWPVAWNILDDLDEDPLRLTRLIAERICPDPMTEMHVVQIPKTSHASPETPHSLISAQSPEQRALLNHAINTSLLGDSGKPASQAVIYLDGPHVVWYQRLQAAYYTIWTELDHNRLTNEARRVNYRESLMNSTDISNLPLFAHANPLIDSPMVALQSHPQPSSALETQTHVETELTRYDMNKALLKHPPSRIPRYQAEYDNRWTVLRQSHVYNFLPTELTTHEQSEGTILAVGVVTPIADALINQKSLYEHITSQELSPTKVNPPDFPPVPSPSPSALIRAWLKLLEIQNPCLSDATIVIRASSITDNFDKPETVPYSEEDGHSELEHGSSENATQTSN